MVTVYILLCGPRSANDAELYPVTIFPNLDRLPDPERQIFVVTFSDRPSPDAGPPAGRTHPRPRSIRRDRLTQSRKGHGPDGGRSLFAPSRLRVNPNKKPRIAAGPLLPRHCEERSDEAIQTDSEALLDCLATLAMTAQSSSRVRKAGANSGSGPPPLSGRSPRSRRGPRPPQSSRGSAIRGSASASQS